MSVYIRPDICIHMWHVVGREQFDESVVGEHGEDGLDENKR